MVDCISVSWRTVFQSNGRFYFSQLLKNWNLTSCQAHNVSSGRFFIFVFQHQPTSGIGRWGGRRRGGGGGGGRERERERERERFANDTVRSSASVLYLHQALLTEGDRFANDSVRSFNLRSVSSSSSTNWGRLRDRFANDNISVSTSVLHLRQALY